MKMVLRGVRMKNKISILDGKTMNLDQIEGRFAAFERLPYAITLRLSKPIAEDGYGSITVDDIEVPKGKQFKMDVVVNLNCLMVPVGSVVKEYDKEYVMRLKGFRAKDGSSFPDTTLKFKTAKRRVNDHSHDVHDDVALQAAREGMVLLKNSRDLLPLKEDAILNCFGYGQFIFRNTASGAGLINPRWQANFQQSIREHSRFSLNKEISDLYLSLENVCPTNEQLLKAKQISDIAIIMITRGSGEFLDNRPVKGGYYLTDEEKKLIEKVCGVFDKTIAILNTGYPIEMSWIEQYDIKSVIYTGFAGMAAGYALMEILDGRCNPSGKLPDSWAYDYYDYPSARNFINLSVDHKQVGEKEFGVCIVYEEDIYVGYRYFDSFNKKTAYCFGHGLSYTDFTYQAVGTEFSNGKIKIDVNVKNTGERSGKETVQIYIGLPEGNIEKPKRVFAAFEKTKELSPGESQIISLITDENIFSSFDEQSSSYILEKGEYTIWFGDSLEHAEIISTFSYDETKQIKKVQAINTPVESFNRMTRNNTDIIGLSESVDYEDRIKVHAPYPVYDPKGLEEYKGKRITFSQLKEDHAKLDDFIAQMSVDELCRLNVCDGADWYMPWQSGAAGKTARLLKYGMPRMRVSDGNTGLNLKKSNIGFPSSCTVAATFNKNLAYNIGKTIAEEAKEHGINLNLGPAMNIHRNILNGRHPEYFSEDPLLSGTMAGYHCKGLEENGCGGTYKHVYCNGSETSRKASHSIVSEQSLREIYCKTFEIAMKIHKPCAVMTSYNAVNGIYPAENAEVLQTLLRDEWGFDGFIMTDWGTYDTVDPVKMVKAGNCWLTEGNHKYVRQLKNAVKNGELSRAVLENNVKWLVKEILNLC